MKVTVRTPETHTIIIATRNVASDGEACHQCGNLPIIYPASMRLTLDTVGTLWTMDGAIYRGAAAALVSGLPTWKCYLDVACIGPFFAAHMHRALVTQTSIVRDITRTAQRIHTVLLQLHRLHTANIVLLADHVWASYHACFSRGGTLAAIEQIHPWCALVTAEAIAAMRQTAWILYERLMHRTITPQDAQGRFREVMRQCVATEKDKLMQKRLAAEHTHIQAKLVHRRS